MSPANRRPDRATFQSRRSSWRCCASGSNRTASRRPNACCSELATTPGRAGRTGHAHGIARSSRSDRSRCGSMTVDMRPRPRGSAPGCPSARQSDDWGHSVETLVSTYVGALETRWPDGSLARRAIRGQVRTPRGAHLRAFSRVPRRRDGVRQQLVSSPGLTGSWFVYSTRNSVASSLSPAPT